MMRSVRVINARSYEDAKKFVNDLGIGSQKEWIEYYKNNPIPDNMPKTVAECYKNKGWKSFADFFETKHYKSVKWMNFKKARRIARSLEIKSQRIWYSYWRTHPKPKGMPSTPVTAYKGEWISWGDWLGNGNVYALKKEFVDYKTAKIILKKEKINSGNDYKRLRSKNKKLKQIPSEPRKHYKEFTTWESMIGDRYVQDKHLSFTQAKEIIHKMGIKTKLEFLELAKQNKLPKGIPHSPNKVYGRTE